jgi:hypothetical protein
MFVHLRVISFCPKIVGFEHCNPSRLEPPAPLQGAIYFSTALMILFILNPLSTCKIKKYKKIISNI